MNSKQLNFYVLPQDLVNVQSFLMANGLLLIKEPIMSNIDSIFTDSVVDPYPTPATFKYYLVHKKHSSEIKLEWIEKQKYFVVDYCKSPVIEFARGYFVPGVKDLELTRARLYFVTAYYENNELVRKDAEFVTEATKLIDKFKKQLLVKHKSFQADWSSPAVIKWIEQEGVKLVI